MKDMKLRIEDAINASRAALGEGVVPGGGVALLRIKTDEQTAGGMILSRAFEQPFRQILVNADEDPDKYISEVRDGDKMNGFNAYTGKIESMWESGILDPVKVTRTALSKAASVATMLLTTGHCIVKEQEQKCSHTKP
jgi:chaperonin GroEL